MQNVTMQVKDNVLTITVNLSEDLGPSRSGKTRLIASTQGNQSIPNDDSVKVGVNVYRKSKGEA